MMNKTFFTRNRTNISRTLSGGLIVLRAYSAVQNTNDSAHSFTQESNFWYLCGIKEPNWLLIIDGVQNRTWLVMPGVSESHALFDGALSANEAKRISGVDSVIGADEGIILLRTLAKRHSLVYTISQPLHAEHFNFVLNAAIAENMKSLARIFSSVEDCRKELSGLRAVKQLEEIKAIQAAISITTDAFEIVRKNMNSYKFEYEIEADFTAYIRRTGASGHAYAPIVASGKNACTLHYSKNSAKLAQHGMVLMDVGASYDGYAADISRTFAYKKPKKRYSEVHAAVRDAHEEIITHLKPMLPLEQYQHSVDTIMINALTKLGLYKDESSLRKYFPHAISHGLGIDVHDSLGGPRYFQENMVLTVEPGIYIPEEGIGVRIEDDILITSTGHKNLSASLSTGL